jgi:hypothetical protein
LLAILREADETTVEATAIYAAARQPVMLDQAGQSIILTLARTGRLAI